MGTAFIPSDGIVTLIRHLFPTEPQELSTKVFGDRARVTRCGCIRGPCESFPRKKLGIFRCLAKDRLSLARLQDVCARRSDSKPLHTTERAGVRPNSFALSKR